MPQYSLKHDKINDKPRPKGQGRGQHAESCLNLNPDSISSSAPNNG